MKEIEHLINYFNKLPTIGKKTATRIALHLLTKDKSLIDNLRYSLKDVQEKIVTCSICANIDVQTPCHICTSTKRDNEVICVVEQIEDLWVVENSGIFKGLYHILGDNLSAVKGVSPQDLNVNSLIKRLEEGEIKELIIAVSSNLDGQTTSLYLSDLLKNKVEKITKLGYGLPLGSELGYLDDGTINAAFQSRTVF